MKRILIVGSGAREHALAWKLRQSSDVEALYLAPGNAGTATLATNLAVAATDLPGIVRIVEECDIALTVVGPEAPLALGLADALRLRGRRVVGPGAAAAQIEASKSFAKQIMRKAGVPTAAYAVFEEPDKALRHLAQAAYPLVVKADGLAAGKGVAVCATEEEARAFTQALMVERVYGAAGERVVVEETLSGPEVSLLALVDGEHVVPLPLAQDHKRLGEGDTGPNTGGMGAYAPITFLAEHDRPACRIQADELTRTILEPVVATLAKAGTPYRGVLFAGLMLTDSGPRVLEFNCRFGDPEAQVILPLLDGDLLPWLEAVADGRLEGPMPVLKQSAVGVVLAAPGYPDKPQVGAPIEGLDDVSPEVLVFHAGTALNADGHIVTAGGRVLTIVGRGDTIQEAAQRAYAAPVRFEGMQRRSDIAWQAIHPHPPAPSPARQERGRFAAAGLPSPPRGRGVGGEGANGIAVLASGEGTNLQALLDACNGGELNAAIAVVVSNNPEARALERARRAGVPAIALPLEDRRDGLEPTQGVPGRPMARREHEQQLLEALRPFDPDLIVLAGWMLILSREFLEQCSCPLINVHPALLPMDEYDDLEIPALRGAHAVRDALRLGLPYTGVSIHYVTPEVDAGPLVLRKRVSIEPDDDEESLYRRIKAVEHRLLPQAVQAVLRSDPYTVTWNEPDPMEEPDPTEWWWWRRRADLSPDAVSPRAGVLSSRGGVHA